MNLLIKLIGLRLNIASLLNPSRVGKMGLEYFGNPGKTNVNQKHLAFFKTSEKSDFQFEGHKVQVYRWGNGPAKILFLHGWQSHTYRWKRYVESLDKDRFTMYSIDGLSHGLSGGTYFNVAMFGQLIREFIILYGKMDFVVGHSMGCFSALNVFYHFPELTPKAAVLLAPPGEASLFFRDFMKRAGLTRRTSALLELNFKKLYGEPVTDFSASRYASTLKIPGLIIHDIDDDDTSIDNARSIHDRWKNSKLIETQGFGHNLRSEEVVSFVYQFLMSFQITQAK
ncbi:MAG: alpha/beta hydrolase [Chryseolinea sp.]